MDTAIELYQVGTTQGSNGTGKTGNSKIKASRSGKDPEFEEEKTRKTRKMSIWGAKWIELSLYIFSKSIGQLDQRCQISEATFQVSMIQTYCCI